MKTLYLIMATCLPLITQPTYGEIIMPEYSTVLPKTILAPNNISAIANMGEYLIVGSDEAVGEKGNENVIQLLKRESNGQYQVTHNHLLLEANKSDGRELDIEGLATEGHNVYVVGSHSSKRKKIDPSESYKKNRKTFFDKKIKEEKNRDWLFHLKLSDEGVVQTKEHITLRKIIKNDPVLKTFIKIPSKENGVDIEGIAVKDSWLYLGFRGPVLRDNYVPVMKLKFDDAEKTNELLYVNLNGRGIRDIASVSDGFLILAGPVGGNTMSYQLYHWNGMDVIPGKDRKAKEIGRLKLLGEIEPPMNGKAEGISVVKEDEQQYKLLMIYDGVIHHMDHYKIDK